jgi:hypothetical protein
MQISQQQQQQQMFVGLEEIEEKERVKELLLDVKNVHI